MVILSSKPQPSLVEDDLIVPSVDIIRSIVPILGPGKLETGAAANESSFEVVDVPGKGKGMLAKRFVCHMYNTIHDDQIHIQGNCILETLL